MILGGTKYVIKTKKWKGQIYPFLTNVFLTTLLIGDLMCCKYKNRGTLVVKNSFEGPYPLIFVNHKDKICI